MALEEGWIVNSDYFKYILPSKILRQELPSQLFIGKTQVIQVQLHQAFVLVTAPTTANGWLVIGVPVATWCWGGNLWCATKIRTPKGAIEKFPGDGDKDQLGFFSNGLPRSSVEIPKTRKAVDVPFFYTVVVAMTSGGNCRGLGTLMNFFGAWIHTCFLL